MRVRNLNPDDIEPSPYRLRVRESVDKDELKKLRGSVAEFGILEPVHVRKRGDGYQIISGERRWRVAKDLELEEVPAIVKEVTDREHATETLIENVQREDLAEIEKGEGLFKIFKLHGFEFSPIKLSKLAHKIADYRSKEKKVTGTTEKKISKIIDGIGLGPGYVRSLLSLASLPKKIRDKELAKKDKDRLDHYILHRITKIDDEELQEKVYEHFAEKRPSKVKASKIITEVKRASEPVKDYILGTDPKEVDIGEIRKIRATFADEEDQEKVIKTIGKAGSISKAIETVEEEKGEKDAYEEFTVKVRVYEKGEVTNEGFVDNRIVDRFHTRDKRRFPIRANEVVCPSFTELKWARGCPFDCSWCYLQGTLRHQKEGKSPVVYDCDEVEKRVLTHLKWSDPEIFVTGEIADSLMHENADPPFSRFIMDLFKKHGNGHKVLFLSKSSYVKNILESNGQDVAIVSFSLNPPSVAEKWEGGSPPQKRIEAAKKVYEAGYETRIRIDPMVPIEGWEEAYKGLVEDIFKAIEPERITVGSLRGLQSTINEAKDKSWVKYLSEKTEWGKKIDFETRFQMYKSLVEWIREDFEYKGHLAMCKETLGMWTRMGWNYRDCRCNCVW